MAGLMHTPTIRYELRSQQPARGILVQSIWVPIWVPLKLFRLQQVRCCHHRLWYRKSQPSHRLALSGICSEVQQSSQLPRLPMRGTCRLRRQPDARRGLRFLTPTARREHRTTNGVEITPAFWLTAYSLCASEDEGGDRWLVHDHRLVHNHRVECAAHSGNFFYAEQGHGRPSQVQNNTVQSRTKEKCCATVSLASSIHDRDDRTL